MPANSHPGSDTRFTQDQPAGMTRRDWLRAATTGVVSAAAGLGSTASAQDLSAPPVRIFNNNGSANPAAWTRITGLPTGLNPSRIVLDNGRIRLLHPPSEPSEKAGHVMYVNFRGQYLLAGDLEFGDWSYCGSSFTEAPTDFRILENTDNCVRIRMSFANHRNQFANGESMPVEKYIILHRGSWGYRAVFDVDSDLSGEREVGFGGTQTHLFCYSNSKAVLWDPNRPPPTSLFEGTDYEWIRDDEQASGDWWGVGLAFNLGFYRMVAVRPPRIPPSMIRPPEIAPPARTAGIRTGQFSGGNTGHLIHWSFQQLRRYEAFVAAVPYDGTNARNITVRNGVASVNVPRDGTYSLYTRTVQGRRDTYVPALRGLRLRIGWNSVNVRNLSLDAPVIVPIVNGQNLPHDLFAQYYNRRWD